VLEAATGRRPDVVAGKPYRPLFDEISARYRTDMDFRRVVDRFLVDFEWLVRDIESKDASGRSVQNHLISDSGRVYLFLAHASGRLR